MTKKYTYLVSGTAHSKQMLSVYDSLEELTEGLPHNHATLSGDLLEGDGYDRDGVFKWLWKLGDIETEEFAQLSFPVTVAESTASWYHEGHDKPSYTTLKIERWETNWREVHFFEN